MPLKFKPLAVAVAATLYLSGSVAAQEQGPGRILHHVVEIEPLKMTSARVIGVENGARLQVSVSIESSPEGDIVSARAESEGTLIGSTFIDYAIIANIDLSSLQVFSNHADNGLVIVEARYGDENYCFVNDDGRSRLRLLFRRDRPVERYLISYSTCDPVVQPLS